MPQFIPIFVEYVSMRVYKSSLRIGDIPKYLIFIRFVYIRLIAYTIIIFNKAYKLFKRHHFHCAYGNQVLVDIFPNISL